MNVRSMFPSKFVAANDLCGQDVAVVIAGLKVEKVGSDDEQRPVVYFQGMSKGMTSVCVCERPAFSMKRGSEPRSICGLLC